MGVEAPLALVALIAAAAPLALHLRSRRAARTVPFPNVELVRELSRESRRERVLADAPLMAARAAVVAFAALALSRPYWGGIPPAETSLAEGDVVVLLDRSAAWGDGEGFREARAAALDAFRYARHCQGEAYLLPFDDVPGPVLGGRGLRAPLLSGRRRSMDAAVAAAASLVGRGGRRSGSFGGPACPDGRGGGSTPASPGTLVVVTTPDGIDEALAAGAPTGVRLVVFSPPGAGRKVGRFEIVDAELVGPVPRVDGKLRVRARVRRSGRAAMPGRLPGGTRRYAEEDAARGSSRGPGPVLGLVQGIATRHLPTVGVDISNFPEDEAGERECVIEAKRERPGPTLVRVELRTPAPGRFPPFVASSRRYLAVPPVDRLRVLAISYDGKGSEKDMLVLQRAAEALAAASQASATVLPIDVVSLPMARVSRRTAEAFDAVLLGDVAAADEGELHRLQKSVIRGTSLVAFAPGEVPGAALPVFGIVRVDGRAAAPAGQSVGGRRAETDFGETVGLAGLGKARFRSWAKLEPRERTLLSFRTGDPALVERRLIMGRACLFAAGLGDLAENPSVLVPFVDAILRLAAVRRRPPVVLDALDAPGVVRVGRHAECVRLLWNSPTDAWFAVDLSAAAGTPSSGGSPRALRAMAVMPSAHPGLWRLTGTHIGGKHVGYVERLVVVKARDACEEAPPAQPPPGGGEPRAGEVRVVRTKEELLDTLRGRGARSLAGPVAVLALLAMAAELALIGRRRRGGTGNAAALDTVTPGERTGGP